MFRYFHIVWLSFSIFGSLDFGFWYFYFFIFSWTRICSCFGLRLPLWPLGFDFLVFWTYFGIGFEFGLWFGTIASLFRILLLDLLITDWTSNLDYGLWTFVYLFIRFVLGTFLSSILDLIWFRIGFWFGTFSPLLSDFLIFDILWRIGLWIGFWIIDFCLGLFWVHFGLGLLGPDCRFRFSILSWCSFTSIKLILWDFWVTTVLFFHLSL